MSDEIPIYLFRGSLRSGNTVASAAPLEVVVSVYGGGGLFGEGGVKSAFGGAAFFRNKEGSPSYVGVWSARKASRFRQTLRLAGVCVKIVYAPPPARLMFWSTQTRRGTMRKYQRREHVRQLRSGRELVIRRQC